MSLYGKALTEYMAAMASVVTATATPGTRAAIVMAWQMECRLQFNRLVTDIMICMGYRMQGSTSASGWYIDCMTTVEQIEKVLLLIELENQTPTLQGLNLVGLCFS